MLADILDEILLQLVPDLPSSSKTYAINKRAGLGMDVIWNTSTLSIVNHARAK